MPFKSYISGPEKEISASKQESLRNHVKIYSRNDNRDSFKLLVSDFSDYHQSAVSTSQFAI
jgi:hypothetical protein